MGTRSTLPCGRLKNSRRRFLRRRCQGNSQSFFATEALTVGIGNERTVYGADRRHFTRRFGHNISRQTRGKTYGAVFSRAQSASIAIRNSLLKSQKSAPSGIIFQIYFIPLSWFRRPRHVLPPLLKISPRSFHQRYAFLSILLRSVVQRFCDPTRRPHCTAAHGRFVPTGRGRRDQSCFGR